MSLFKKRTTAEKAAPVKPDAVKLRVTDVKEWHPGGYYGWDNMYHAGDIGSGRYNIGIERSEDRVLSICDTVLHVRAVISAGKRPVKFYASNASRKAMDAAKGYRLDGATHESVQGLPLLDDDTMLQLVADSKKNDPEMWRNAMVESRKTRVSWLRYYGGIGAAVWGGAAILATFITLSSVGAFAS